MANINDEARIPVYLNDEQAVAAMKNLQQEADKWRKKMHEAMAGGDMKGMKVAERELKKVNKETSKLRKAAFDTNKVLNNISSASYKDLRQTLRTLSREQEQFNRKSREWKTHQKNIRLVRAEMKKVNGQLQAQSSIWGKAANGFNKYFGMATAGVAALTGVLFSVKEWTKGLVGLDDALADVMKTTGLTRKEARGLYDDFKYLNTRTPRKELLLLAEEAGRLGKKSRKDVMDFVEVTNMISVSLGDDLGDNAEVATREVGKLTDNLNVGAQYGVEFGEAMEKAGSGINEVAANSKAQAGYIIEFTKRTQDLGEQANITAADLFGLAATFDESGQAVEMSATAVNKIIVDMFTDAREYAKVAGMSLVDFTELLNTDANEAFIQMLKGLEGNNEGLGVMVKKFDALGIDGTRATQAMASLVGNLDRLAINQEIANKAMTEGTSLANEYNVKNNNLAGSMDKIGRYMRSKFINSGFLEWMEKAVSKTAEWVEVPLADKIRKERSELNVLIGAIGHANTTQQNRNDLIKELQKTYPDFLGNLDAEKVTNEELRDRLTEVNEQYENKILLAIKDDKLKDNYNERTDLQLEELDLLQEIHAKELEIAELEGKQSEFAPASSEWMSFSGQLTNAAISLDSYNKKLESNRDRVVELREEEEKLNEAIAKMTSNIVGNKTPEPKKKKVGGTGGGSNTYGLSDYEEDEEDAMGVDDWMVSDKWDTYGAEELAARKASEQEWTEFLKREIEKRSQAAIKALEIEKEISDAREDLKLIQVAAIGQLASSLAGMFEQGSAAQIAMIAIEKASAIAQIWINLAKEKSAINFQAALMGPLGVPWRAAMTAKAIVGAKVNTGLVLAQTVASTVSSKKREKTQAYAQGKYPGVQTGTYGNRPHYALFNEVPGYPEMVVDGKTFKTMQMDYPGLIQAIYNVRDGKQPSGYAQGKYPEEANPTQPYTDPGLKTLIAENIETMKALQLNGIKAYVNKYGTNGLDEAISDIAEFKSKVYKK